MKALTTVTRCKTSYIFCCRIGLNLQVDLQHREVFAEGLHPHCAFVSYQSIHPSTLPTLYVLVMLRGIKLIDVDTD